MEFVFKCNALGSSIEPDWKGLKKTTEKEHSAMVLLQKFCNVILDAIEQLKHRVGIWWAENVAEMQACFLFSYITEKYIELWNANDLPFPLH